MSNMDLLDREDTGESMTDTKPNVSGIDWKQTAQWVLAALLTLFLFSVNSQAADLKSDIRELKTDVSQSVSRLNTDVQQIKIDMSARLTRLETLQALQASQCK